VGTSGKVVCFEELRLGQTQQSSSTSIPTPEGVLLASKFQHPQPIDTPNTLFNCGCTSGVARIQQGQGETRKVEFIRTAKHTRFVRKTNPSEVLIFTAGACLNKGRSKPNAGCGFVFLPRDSEASPQVRYGTVSFRLEGKSPNGSPAEQTSNRAELRAAMAALQFRNWHAEGWKRIVIATDSEYAINGATEWVTAWVRKNWITSKKVPVRNRDLCELLMKEIKRLGNKCVEVLFWKIPRD